MVFIKYSNQPQKIMSRQTTIAFFICLVVLIIAIAPDTCSARMVRLCIASVDPIKLSSQCVMCNRREFPLTVIDCTGINKMNDLIANPLSVQDATCLIYNCRRQVPDVKPEPYHGSVSQAMRTNYPLASGTRSYEMMSPPAIYGGYSEPIPVSRFASFRSPSFSGLTPFSPLASNLMASRPQALPYALVPATYTSPFGARKFKAALIPLFKR